MTRRSSSSYRRSIRANGPEVPRLGYLSRIENRNADAEAATARLRRRRTARLLAWAIVQAHVSYTIRPRMWVAVDGTYYTGGRTTVNGRLNTDLQSNSRVGLTASVPIGLRSSIKLAWSHGARTSIGADFTTWATTYQLLWFDR